MEFIEKYALLYLTIFLSVILLSITIGECFQQNKLKKGKLTLSIINIFILILFNFFYDKFIVNILLVKYFYYGYLIVVFISFATICLITVNSYNQKANNYSQFINSLNNTDWNVYFVCDKKDRIKEISESFLLDLGLKKEQVVGKKAFDIFDQTIRFTHVNDIEITNKELREYYKTFGQTSKVGEEIKREVYFKNTNGQTIVYNLIEKPLFISGKYKGRLNIGQKKNDLSLTGIEKELVNRNKALESIQYKFIAALELTEEGIFFNDLDDNYIWNNDVLVKDLKLNSNTIAYMSYRDLIYPEDLDVYTSTIRSLTPERPSYSLTYRFRVGDKYEFVKETGKRIFDDPNSNVILGFSRKIETNHFEKTNMPEIDSAKTLDDLLNALDSLYSERRIFQLVCVNLTTLPDINNRNGRAVGNMIMNEYLKRLKSNFMSDSGVIYRASGLVFYFIITDVRKMEFFKRGLTADPNSMNLTVNYGSMQTNLKVNIGVAESMSDGINKEELIRNCNAAINTSLTPNYSLNYAYFKDIKNTGIR